MSRLSIILLSFVLLSCAFNAEHSPDALYMAYQEYQSVVASKDVYLLSSVISKRYLKVMNEDAKHIPRELGLDMPLWKALAKKIRTEYSHVENIQGDSGCLTINGLNKLERPISLSLYYIKEDGLWLFDNVMVAVHDSIMDYYTEPTCPSPKEALINSKFRRTPRALPSGESRIKAHSALND